MMAATRQISRLVLLRHTITPLRKGSVFEALIFGSTFVGVVPESMDMSVIERCTAGSYAEEDGTVASPDRRKPKKQAHAVAHSIALSNDTPPTSQQCFSDLDILKVTGKRVRGELP